MSDGYFNASHHTRVKRKAACVQRVSVDIAIDAYKKNKHLSLGRFVLNGHTIYSDLIPKLDHKTLSAAGCAKLKRPATHYS
jgi:hypothetical protein